MNASGRSFSIGITAFAAAGLAMAAARSDIPLERMKSMSLEELMDIEVTLVSRHAEKLSEAASAVQVIRQEDIRRSGATTLPEALRLAYNLHVAQVDGREWAISARGFNNTAANKLLVMIDGRTVYTPLYSGVFWDAQFVLLEDIDRIEVVSGPGGTLWGSNAVNGVINIVTRSAKDTQGGYFSAGGGTEVLNFVQGRFGEKFGKDGFYRVYGQSLNRKGTLLESQKGFEEANNGSGIAQGGFRADWNGSVSGSDHFTMQGDVYDGRYGERNSGTDVNGQNIIGRWTRTFSEQSDFQVQAYFDHTWRRSSFAPGLAFAAELQTYDIEFHHRFGLIGRQNILWGAGYRLLQDEERNFPFLAFLPAEKTLHRLNAFVQDEITLLPNRLKLTLGTKIEQEHYDGVNFQPAVRTAWTPTGSQTIWASVSRAVRTPSRIDVEFYAPEPPVNPLTLKFAGSPDFGSEKLLAYELGYRIQPIEAVSLSLAGFYNQYDDMRSVEIPHPDILNPTVEFLNGLIGDSRGVEISGRVQAFPWWTLRAGYTYLEKDIWTKDGHLDFTNPRGEWNDPSHQVSFQSMTDLPAGFQVNVQGYYVDDLPLPAVQGRFAYDAGLVWIHGNVEVSLQGRNLADDRDPEFAVKDRVVQEVPRSVYGRIAWRL
jgi:iron complex outermembrane receptor protein